MQTRKGIWARCSTPETGLFILRVVLGVIFLVPGWEKLADMAGTVSSFSGFGIPVFVSYLVAVGEFVAGIAMILGIFTRPAAYVITLIMVGALYLVKIPQGGLAAGEFQLLIMAAALCIAYTGPGRWALGPETCSCCHSGTCDSSNCTCHTFCGTMKCGDTCACGSGEKCGCNTCGITKTGDSVKK